MIEGDDVGKKALIGVSLCILFYEIIKYKPRLVYFKRFLLSILYWFITLFIYFFTIKKLQHMLQFNSMVLYYLFYAKICTLYVYINIFTLFKK